MNSIDNSKKLIGHIIECAGEDISSRWEGDKSTVNDYLSVKITENPENDNVNKDIINRFGVDIVDNGKNYQWEIYYSERIKESFEGNFDINQIYKTDVQELRFKKHDVLENTDLIYDKYSECYPREDIYFPIELYYGLKVLEDRNKCNLHNVLNLIKNTAIEYSCKYESNFSILHGNDETGEWVRNFVYLIENIDNESCTEIVNLITGRNKKRRRYSDLNEGFKLVRVHVKDIVKSLTPNEQVLYIKIYAAFLTFWHCRYKGGDESLADIMAIIEGKEFAFSEDEFKQKPKIASEKDIKSPKIEKFVMNKYQENGHLVFQWDGNPEFGTLLSLLYLDGKEYLDLYDDDKARNEQTKKIYNELCISASENIKNEEKFDGEFIEYLKLRDEYFCQPQEGEEMYRTIRERISAKDLLKFVLSVFHRPNFGPELMGGKPDLFVITESGIEMVEVKSKNDELTGSQYTLFNKIPKEYRDVLFIQRLETS